MQIDEDNNIKNSRCNCPYDFTFTCKHEVAAYYKIRETVECLAEKIYRDVVFEQETKSLVENYKENLENIEKNKEEHVQKISELLETYSKEKLLDILLEIVEENGAVRERFLKEIERKEALQLDEREVLTNYNEKIDKLFLEYEELEEQGIEDYENGYSYGHYHWEEYDDDYVDTEELENKIKMTEQQAKSAPLMLEYNGTNEKIADVVQKENREVVAKEIKEKFPNKDIWLWTGYTLNQILKIDETLLENIDILVDGRYECDLPHTKRYRGSDNQLRYKINKREYILLD